MKRQFLFLNMLVALQVNFVVQASETNWTYIPVDDAKQKWGDWDEPEWLRYFGLDFGDVDRDGNIDIISGRYVYHNPGGNMENAWARTMLDENVDAIFAIDADGDPFMDIIAQALPNIYWYEAINQEGTRYTRKLIATIPQTSHVNSQGYEKAQIVAGGPLELLIASNGNIYCISIPENPDMADQWPTQLIAKNTSDEGIGVGDINNDGLLDIACGRRPDGEDEPLTLVWFENPGNINTQWEDHFVGRTDKPIDRVELGNLNGDGHLEIVISEERYPGQEPDGKLLWFSRQHDGYQTWSKHHVVTQYSMNNLDLADIDQDGDIDIITNEHKGPRLETQLWINDGDGQFTKRILDAGKENHLGTQFVDLDGDGDLDVAGCAWDNYQWMHVWRNDEVKPIVEGSIFREYRWAAKSVSNSTFLRVGGRLDYQTDANHFPPENMRDGFIHLADEIDLTGATHAELVIERLQCHEDTKGLRININNNDWLRVHEPQTIPEPATDYMFHFYPKVNVPLSHLQGDNIEFKMEVNDQQRWNWPQTLIYGIILRVYYEDDKCDFNAHVIGVSDHQAINAKSELALQSDQLEAIKKVDYIGFYEDVNWPGDGIYRRWQYHTHETKIRNHIGGSGSAPFTVEWDTQWLPDQTEPINVIARVELKNGLIIYTDAIEGLRLQRDYSVALIKPYGQPTSWVTRSGEHVQYLYLEADPESISQAKLYWRSWSPCYAEGIKLNDVQITGDSTTLDWPCYAYYEHRTPVSDLSIFKEGINTLTTLKTPLHDGKMVHGMEVQWPGIMMKVKIKKDHP